MRKVMKKALSKQRRVKERKKTIKNKMCSLQHSGTMSSFIKYEYHCDWRVKTVHLHRKISGFKVFLKTFISEEKRAGAE